MKFIKTSVEKALGDLYLQTMIQTGAIWITANV